MRIWVTRAEPGASATAERLRAMGHEPLVGPLLFVRDLVSPTPPDGVAALAFTSANGAAAFARRSLVRDLPVFTVGDTTAKAARSAGYSDVRSADGDVEALAALILANPVEGLVLHPAAAEPAGDLVGALQAGGQAAGRLTVYETAMAAALPQGAGTCEAVLVHSPRAGEALVRLAPPGFAAAMAAYVLSPSCTEPLADLGFRSMAVAETPHEASLLALLPEPRGAEKKKGFWPFGR